MTFSITSLFDKSALDKSANHDNLVNMDKDNYEQSLFKFINSSQALRPEFLSNYYQWPILNEDTGTTHFDEHYLYHAHWALKKIAESRPLGHVDFSSSLNFISSCSVITKVLFYDFRPPHIHLDNLTCKKTDLTLHDPDIKQGVSVSCMHVVEHIGLGRYGDQLDACGDLKAINNLMNYVAPGGRLLFVVPVGKPGIWFNAHRVYNPKDIVSYFSKSFTLSEFYFIPADMRSFPARSNDLNIANNYVYSCGCFEFIKNSVR